MRNARFELASGVTGPEAKLVLGLFFVAGELMIVFELLLVTPGERVYKGAP